MNTFLSITQRTLTLAFLATASTLNLLEHLSGKIIALVTKMANIYREESPTAIYTRFDANLVVATASF